MLNFDLIKNILVVAIGSSVITTAIVQKIKETMSTKKYIGLISLGVSMVIGTLFAYFFSDLSLISCLWVGLCSWLGADTLYKTFEDKLFTPFKKMNEVVEVPKENEVVFDEGKDE